MKYEKQTKLNILVCNVWIITPYTVLEPPPKQHEGYVDCEIFLIMNILFMPLGR